MGKSDPSDAFPPLGLRFPLCPSRDWRGSLTSGPLWPPVPAVSSALDRSGQKQKSPRLTPCSWQICVSLSSCSSWMTLALSYCWMSIPISTFTGRTYAGRQSSPVKSEGGDGPAPTLGQRQVQAQVHSGRTWGQGWGPESTQKAGEGSTSHPQYPREYLPASCPQ